MKLSASTAGLCKSGTARKLYREDVVGKDDAMVCCWKMVRSLKGRVVSCGVEQDFFVLLWIGRGQRNVEGILGSPLHKDDWVGSGGGKGESKDVRQALAVDRATGNEPVVRQAVIMNSLDCFSWRHGN